MTLFLSFLIPPASGHKITFGEFLGESNFERFKNIFLAGIKLDHDFSHAAILHLINSWHPVYYYNWVFPGLLDGPDKGGPLSKTLSLAYCKCAYP